MNLTFVRQHSTTVMPYFVLVILFILFSFLSDIFMSYRNIENILMAAVALGLVSIGQTFAILSEGLDLSVGSVVSLTTCLTAGMINGQGYLVLPVVLLVIFIALFIGFCNGFIIVKTGVSPLIVTLGMMSIVQGAALLYTIGPIGAMPELWGNIAWGRLLFLPVPIMILAIVAALGIFVLRRTIFGRYLYATGGNDEIARLSGINTSKIRIVTYMICSFTAALTGLFLTSRMGMGDPVVGESYMIESLVPVLVGGTAFAGGKGGVVGTLAGVFILAVVMNAMNIFSISTYYEWIVVGGIILLVASFYLQEKA